MKEITRRIYTKPVMLGMAFLVGIALLVALSVKMKSTAAVSPLLPAGADQVDSPGHPQTYHHSRASPVPAGFFGTGSQHYAGLVRLVGLPLQALVNDADRIIHRNQNVSTAGS